MHEHGILDRLMELALGEARRRGGELRGVRVRLGALAASTPEQLRHDFEHLVHDHMAGAEIALEIDHAPSHPAGVELVSIDVAERIAT